MARTRSVILSAATAVSLMLASAETASSAEVTPSPAKPCSALTFTGSGDAQRPAIDWSAVDSDEEAVACMTRVAEFLGPDDLPQWLTANGFRTMIFPVNVVTDQGFIVSASWPNGRLYSTTFFETLLSAALVHSHTFSFTYERGRALVVRQSRGIK